MNLLSQSMQSHLYCVKPHTMSFNEGIMTATDETSFVGFQLLYSSIVAQYCCFVCLIDMGINDEQKEWCQNKTNLIIIHPDTSILKFTGEKNWNKWNKSYFIMFSPFQKTLWLDTNVMVLGDLTHLFRMMCYGPIIFYIDEEINFNDWVAQNVSVPDKQVFYPTTTVMGFDIDRDFYIIRDWMWAVENIVTDSRLSGSASKSDSAALMWSLIKHKKPEIGMKNIVWNWPFQGGLDKKTYIDYPTPEKLFTNVRNDFSGVNILNWGWPPPWMSWPGYTLNLETQRPIC